MDNKIFFNNPSVISNEYLQNGSPEIRITTIRILINNNDIDGDLLNYSIETNPNIGSINNLSGPGELGGVKTCSISGLAYSTTYTWYVNVTDGTDWTNETFWFETENPP